MEDKTKLLLSKISDLIAIFREYKVTQWEELLEDVTASIDSYPVEGIDLLLSTYGGMGSITDVYITPEAGFPIDEKEVSQVNKLISTLLSEVYELAMDLKHDLSE